MRKISSCLTLVTPVLAQTSDEESALLVLWIVLPATLLFCSYTMAAYYAWPYARPLMPLGILLLAIVFPPLFPLLLLYIFCLPPWRFGPRPVASNEVVVVRVESSRPPSRSSSSRPPSSRPSSRRSSRRR